MTIDDKPLEELTPDEIKEALLTPKQPSVNNLVDNSDELRAMGIRDISLADDAEQEVMKNAMQNIQIQRSLSDLTRGSNDNRSPRDYLENHLGFLVKISPGKTKQDIVASMTLDHVISILKTSAKMDISEALAKKHLKNIKKKYK